MKELLAVLGTILVTGTSLAARDNTDLIVMENGDRITGEIKGVSAGVLTVSLDYVDGNVSLQWSKVKRIESTQLFIVQTQNGSVYTGALLTDESSPGEGLRIHVAQPEEPVVPIQRSDIVRVEETSYSFLRRLSGDISLGATYSKGNNTTQYNLGGTVESVRAQWGAEATFSSNLSASTGAETATRNQVTLEAWRRLRRNNWFYSGFGSFLQSSVQGIDAQTTVGGGIGRFFKNTNRARISLLGGAAWRSTGYKPDLTAIERQQVYGAVLAAEIRFFFFKRTNLTLDATLVPALSEPGRVYFDTDISYYLKLFSNLHWNLSFYGNWDTRPPQNFAGSDYGYSTGIRWTFGYR